MLVEKKCSQRAVLRHELSHLTRVATFLACRGAPGCGLFLVQAGRCWPRQGPTATHTLEKGVEVFFITSKGFPEARRSTSSWAICGQWLWTRSGEKVVLGVRQGTTTEVWRVRLAALSVSGHWAMADGVVARSRWPRLYTRL